MERNEAKAILELHRPGNTDDRDDPLIAEALQQLDTDAELRDWFDAQQASTPGSRTAWLRSNHRRT